MCMEDVRIGRKQSGKIYSVAVTTAGNLVVPFNSKRRSLVISCPVAKRVTLNTAEGVALDAGLNLYAGGGPLRLDVDKHGPIVYGPLYGIADTASDVIGYAESCLEGE